MNLRDLKYLIALADYGQFNKAAEACFVSQPGLSMQIKKLENTLGVQLIERTNKSVLLTDIGQLIIKRARVILNEVDELYEAAKLAQNPYCGDLHLGVIPTLAPYLLPKIIPTLSTAFPKLSFYLIEEQTHVLLEKLQQGTIQAALLALPIEDNHLSHSLLFEETFLLAVQNTDPLTKRKKIQNADLKDKKLLLLAEGHCLRSQSLAVCQQMQATEHASFRATSLETLRHMVMSGVGITLMPQLACYPSENIAYIRFQSPQPSRNIALFWRTTSAKYQVFEEMAAQIRSAIDLGR